ncbi:MAG: hypothetical protein ABSC95_10760 [Acetobacteraceae bacterium]|jgi:adenylate kinase family enzyme
MTRIHVLGASGSGTTTLGAALAARLGCPHEDTDDHFWLPTDPLFTTRRPAEARLARLLPRLAGATWVLSGSALKWGASLEPLYDLVVFLRLDPALRMARLCRREAERYGARIAPGGDMVVASHAFLDWAESYDTAGPEHRSLAAHERWLAERTCPVLRLTSTSPVEDLVAAVLGHLSAGARLV